MENVDFLKKIRLISRYGFLASSLLNIGAMNNISNLKEKCSKENSKIENNFNNSFLLETTIKTCKKCNDIEKIKIDLTKILNSMEKIFLEVLNKYGAMQQLACNLYFGQKEDDVLKNIDKFQMLLNLLDDDLSLIIIEHIKNNQLLYNIDTKTISEFKKQFKNDNKNDIVDYLTNKFLGYFKGYYCYTDLSDGCFGLTYKSDKIKTLLVKELRKQPICSVANKYNTKEELKNLKIGEYRNYLEKKDILPDYICKYYINLWSKIVILQMIQGEPYKDFNGSKNLSDTVENNIKKIIYINNCFNDLKNKIGYRLIDRHGGNMVECIHCYLYQIDIDDNSFSKEEEINSFYFYDLKNLILKNKNGTSFSYLEDQDFEIYEKVLDYYKIYDVDFLHCILNNTYRKSPMFYLSNLINSLVRKNNTYYCHTNNITFIKILKFIDNVNRFKNEINNNKLFTLYSIVYNGNEENYDKDISPLYLTNYKISQNNIDDTWKEDKTIEGFVNEMLKRKSCTLDLDNEYIKKLNKNISLINLNEKTINNFNEIGEIFAEMKNFSKSLDYNFLRSSNKKIKDLLHINDIVNKIVKKCSEKKDFEENFYKKIFRINENGKSRNLKPEELEQLEYSDNRFLFKNKIEFEDLNIDIKTYEKFYYLNDIEKGILNFYKTVFLEKCLKYMLMFEVNEIKNRSIDDIYNGLHYVFFGFNELLNLRDKDLFYLNLFLFPRDIYRKFYNLYLKESAKLLFKSYIKEFIKINKFNSINILKVKNFGTISRNQEFDILDEFLGEDYLFKDLLGEDKYAIYLYLKEERSKKIKDLYNEFYGKGNGSIIIENYKNGLNLLKEIIDLFLSNDKLDVKSRANAICNNKEYEKFINKYLPGYIILKNTQTISEFIDILKLILEKLNKTLENIDEKHKKNLTDEKMQKKIENLKSKFFESAYFKKLLNSFSVKIKKLDIILSKFLKLTDEVEDKDNTYFNVSLNEECVNKIFDNCKEFLNKDEINNGKKINDLDDLNIFLLNCLNNKNIDDYEFDDLKNFKKKINSLKYIKEYLNEEYVDEEIEDENRNSEEKNDYSDEDNKNDDSYFSYQGEDKRYDDEEEKNDIEDDRY